MQYLKVSNKLIRVVDYPVILATGTAEKPCIELYAATEGEQTGFTPDYTLHGDDAIHAAYVLFGGQFPDTIDADKQYSLRDGLVHLENASEARFWDQVGLAVDGLEARAARAKQLWVAQQGGIAKDNQANPTGLPDPLASTKDVLRDLPATPRTLNYTGPVPEGFMPSSNIGIAGGLSMTAELTARRAGEE